MPSTPATDRPGQSGHDRSQWVEIPLPTGSGCAGPCVRAEFRGHAEFRSSEFRGSSGTPLHISAEFRGGVRAGCPQGITPLGVPQIRTCTFAHTAPHIMSSLRDGSLSESAIRLVPVTATVVVLLARLWVSMHPPCVPPTVS